MPRRRTGRLILAAIVAAIVPLALALGCASGGGGDAPRVDSGRWDPDAGGPGPQVFFYVDPDYPGADPDGSPGRPWTSLGSGGAHWVAINAALASDSVAVYFSAREAATEVDQASAREIRIERTDGSTHRLTLDGMSKYNRDDAAPAWLDYTGSARHAITAQYPISTGPERRDNVTIRGFKTVSGAGGRGGQGIYYWGGDFIVIEHNELSHDPRATHGPALQFDGAYSMGRPANGGSTNIIIAHNVIHDTRGACIHVLGADDTGASAHSNVTIEDNQLSDCGIYGQEGDCIRVEDGMSGLVVRNNVCSDGHGTANAGGILSYSAITAESNFIGNMPGAGISLSSAVGQGFADSIIANNIIHDNGGHGIEVTTGVLSRTIANTSVLQNTVTGNMGDGLTIGSTRGGVTNISVRNNIFAQNTTGIGGWGTSTSTVSHNDFWRNATTAAGPFAGVPAINNNISTDPLFVSTITENFRLQSGSPAVDTGTTVTVVVDIEGSPRPQGMGWDMGAYEQAP